MIEAVLYSTGCPMCMVLKKKLDAKGVSYEVVDSIDAMQALGIMHVPVLQVGDEYFDFAEAVEWINMR